MFNYKDIEGTMVSRDSFKYWFKASGYTSQGYKLWETVLADSSGKQPSPISAFFYEEPTSDGTSYDLRIDGDVKSWTKYDPNNEVSSDFRKFKEGRPEYLFAEPVCISTNTNKEAINSNSNVFDICYAGAMLIKADTDEVVPQIQKALTWLHNTDFYTAPAAVRMHEAEDGGLVKHTLMVVNRLLELATHTSLFIKVNLAEAVCAALVHDWCKIYKYVKYMKNVKDEKSGQWKKEEAFKYNENYPQLNPASLLGHGACSVNIARKFMRLSLDQEAAIKWHMGRWDVCESEFNNFSECNKTIPMVHLLQFADQLAITYY